MENSKKLLKNLAKGKKLLLVEDDEKTLEVFQSFLKEFFPLIKSATNGKNAWEIYRKEKFDLIITDIEMPEVNGVFFSKAVKAKNPSQAILVTSAYTDEKYLVELINIGVDGFLKKPINVKNLYERITKALKMVQTENESSRLKFKALTKEITKKEIKNTKSHHQKIIEQTTLNSSKISVNEFLEKIRISEPENYEFFSKQKEILIEVLHDMIDNYEAFAYKNYKDIYSLENIVSDLRKLHDIFSIFEKVKSTTAQIERLIGILEKIVESDLNDSKENAFDILEFLLNDIKQFIVDMFIENSVEDVNYFRDSFRDNITTFEEVLNESNDEEKDEIEFL